MFKDATPSSQETYSGYEKQYHFAFAKALLRSHPFNELGADKRLAAPSVKGGDHIFISRTRKYFFLVATRPQVLHGERWKSTKDKLA